MLINRERASQDVRISVFTGHILSLGAFSHFPAKWLLRRGKRIVIAYANIKGSGEPVYPRSLTRTYAVSSRKR